MGLAPATLHRRNPGLVIIRISGWGQEGPYKRRPGFGTLVEGMSGFASMNGFPDREPVLPPMALPGEHRVPLRFSLNFNGQPLSFERPVVFVVEPTDPAPPK